MDWNQLLSQFPLLGIVGIVAFFLYSENKVLQNKLISISEREIESKINTNILLAEIKELIQVVIVKNK